VFVSTRCQHAAPPNDPTLGRTWAVSRTSSAVLWVGYRAAVTVPGAPRSRCSGLCRRRPMLGAVLGIGHGPSAVAGIAGQGYFLGRPAPAPTAITAHLDTLSTPRRSSPPVVPAPGA